MKGLFVSRFGEVDGESEGFILGTLRDCYRHIGQPELLELWIFDRASTMEAILAEEAVMVGVRGPSSGFGFFATHDAWRGTPRIMVCLERMRGLPRLLGAGGLRHEAGHSVLHGSLEHYIFPMPQELAESSHRLGAPRGFAEVLFYLLSVAIKDFEVSRLLVDHGYIDCQLAYAEYVLKPSREELEAWRLSSTRREKALYIASALKGVGCLAPLLEVRPEAQRVLSSSISHLPEELKGHLEGASELLLRSKGDTFNRLRMISRFFEEKILEALTP